MKISVDGKDLYTLSEIHKQVIRNDIHEDEFEQDMRRRLHWILTHKYERCFERLTQEWMPKLKARVSSLPTSEEELAKLIFSQPDYKSRKQREQEEKIKA